MKKQPVVKEKAAKVKQPKMKIAILSFGSFIKNGAKLVKGKWSNKDTPQLPIELCRISKSGKLVLAVNEENGVGNNVYAAIANETDLNKLIPAFMKVDKIGEKQIGVLDLKNKIASERANKYPKLSRTIAQWAAKNKVDAVVFSLLGRAFKDKINIPFSPQAAIKYIEGLEGKVKKEQVTYLKNIPAGLATPTLDLLKGAK